MHALKRLIALGLMAAVVALSGCHRSMPPSIKPTPPLVTDCLIVPERQLKNPPAPPPTLSDEWALKVWRWASDTIGLVTADRKAWQGERDCIRGKAETGAIR